VLKASTALAPHPPLGTVSVWILVPLLVSTYKVFAKELLTGSNSSSGKAYL